MIKYSISKSYDFKDIEMCFKKLFSHICTIGYKHLHFSYADLFILTNVVLINL